MLNLSFFYAMDFGKNYGVTPVQFEIEFSVLWKDNITSLSLTMITRHEADGQTNSY